MPSISLRIVLAVATLALGLGGCGGRSAPGPAGPSDDKADEAVLVFAAASVSNAVDEVKEQFHRKHGSEVKTSFAGSSILAQQIVEGAGADVFISADTAWADYLGENAMVVQRRDLLGNRLVIVVPADSSIHVQGPEDLLGDAVRHVALADPASVPAGRYAKQVFEKLGIWEKVKAKVVAGNDVRQALGYVETGAAEAGIVYATDAAVSPSVKVAARIRVDLTGPIRYPVVLLKHGSGRPGAERFYQYLSSPEAAEVFRKYGFDVLGDGGTTAPCRWADD
jgi:molybdate transport system substrate-binding protein